MITTTCEAFNAALKTSLKPELHPSIAVLSYAHVTNVCIETTDLDITTVIPYDADGNGDYLIPYRQLASVLKGESGPLTIDSTGEGKALSAVINAGGITYEIQAKPVSEWPVLPKVEGESFVLSGVDVSDMIRRTRFAICKDESRYTLNGALLRIENGIATMVATDGHRLSMDAHKAVTGNFSRVIPTAAIDWLKANIGVFVDIRTNDLTLRIETGGNLIYSKTVVGEFPDYKKVIPTGFSTTATFNDPRPVVDILRRVAKCSSDMGSVLWDFAPGGQISISAKSADSGQASAKIRVKSSGESVGIRWNSDHVAEFLKAAGEDTVRAFIVDDHHAAKFTVVGENWTYILMPMRY
jgi:DNA polymerase-3 subunit beta